MQTNLQNNHCIPTEKIQAFYRPRRPKTRLPHGAKLYYCTANSFKPTQDHFTCANYRSNTGSCSAHFIRAVTLERLVFGHIRNILAFIQQFEESFVRREIAKASEERGQ